MTVTKRVPKEIAAAQNETMRESGIFYAMNESDMRKGRALILGPEDTPYAYCPIVFEFLLPDDYPFSPPGVKVLTSDGKTRFHPNLYIEGKVCLSILGTWAGPKWASTMTISTVLTSIQSILDSNPITNEPGFEKYTLDTPKAKGYRDWVQHQIVSYSIRSLLKGKTHEHFRGFEDVLDEFSETWLTKLKEIVLEKAKEEDQILSSVPYGMSGRTRWKEMADAFRMH